MTFQKIRMWLHMLPLKIADKYLEAVADRSVDKVICFDQAGDNTVLILALPFTAYGMTAPQGFVFDGASSPWFARWIIPKFYKMLKASCRHDWACHNAKNWHERLLADIVFFLMAYYVEKLSLWRCVLGLVGVRIGAFFGIGKNY